MPENVTNLATLDVYSIWKS